MKFFKFFALLALASVPLLLIEKTRREPIRATDADDDDIFERDLRVE